MTDFVDRLTLLLAVEAGGANSVIKGFGATTQTELTKVQDAAGRVGNQAGTLFGTQFSQQAILGLSAIQATLGGIGLSNFAEGAVEEAVKFTRANAELAAQIKSTGDVAGVSTSGIDALSTSIEKSQLIFSGTVKQGAALLLTFQDIRNQQGVGNNVFDRTLTVSAAVANVFNKDITTAVLQVGRALENPQAGLQALSRSGLTLEQQDRVRILNLAKQGDLLGAQKALLDALESRTVAAGAAAAQSDPIQRATLDFQKFKVAIGTDLTGPAKVALAAIEGIEQAFEELPGPIRVATEVLVATGIVIAPIVKIFSILGTLRSIKIAADASSARVAAESLNEQAAATDRATGSTAVLGTQLEVFDAKAAKAAGSSAQLSASLDTVGTGGSGVAAVDTQLEAFDVTAARATGTAATLNAELAAIGEAGSAGIAQIDGQLAIFDADALAASSSASKLGTELDTLGASGAAGIGSVTEQLSLLGTSSSEAAAALPAVNAEINALAADLAPVAEQLAIFEVGLDGIALGLNQGLGQFALFDAAAVDGGASISQLDASSIAAAASVKLVTVAAADAGGELVLFDAAGVQGGLTLARLDASALAAAQAVNLVTIAVGTANEQLTLFGPSTGAVAGSLSAVDAYLAETAAEAAAVELAVAALGDEMSGLGVGAANAAAGMGSVDASLATLDAAAAAAAVPIGVDAEALAELAANAGVAESELALIGPTVAAAATEFVELGGAELIAAEDTGILATALAALTPAGIGVAGALGAAAAGFAAFTISYQGLKALVGGHDTPFNVLSTQSDRLVQDLQDINHTSALQKGFGLSHSIQQDQTDIKNLNAGLEQLADSRGPQAGLLIFNQMKEAFIDAGGSATEFDAALTPAINHLHDLFTASRAAGEATGDLSADFHNLTAGANDVTSGYNAVTESLFAVHDAAAQVALDQADIAGTGKDAVAAAAAVKDAQSGLIDAFNGVGDAEQKLSDAYVRLRDSQDAVGRSVHKLQEAQQAYDLYNSARGALERSLELDTINRRVVTTPAEEDQKRLDLLKFQDDNANKAQSLADQLADAQKGVRDALRGVSDAQRNIVDSQKGVVDATNKVTDAENKVTESIKAQKQVSIDAQQRIQLDQLKLQDAITQSESKIDDLTTKTHVSNDEIQTWIEKLKGAADKYAPGSQLDRNVDLFYTKILGYQIASNALADAAANKSANGPGSNAPGGADRGKALQGFDRSGLSAAQVAALHDLGVPGFADGGTVPGLRGQARLIVAHGGERITREGESSGVSVHQENHFYGDSPSTSDLDWANQKLAWGVARTGRGS